MTMDLTRQPLRTVCAHPINDGRESGFSLFAWRHAGHELRVWSFESSPSSLVSPVTTPQIAGMEDEVVVARAIEERIGECRIYTDHIHAPA